MQQQAQVDRAAAAAPNAGRSNNRLVHTIRYGAIRAAVWRNVVDLGNASRELYSVTFSRSYRDGDNQWKDSGSFGSDDLLVAGQGGGRGAHLDRAAKVGRREASRLSHVQRTIVKSSLSSKLAPEPESIIRFMGYEQFRERRDLWLQCLSGDDRHSVSRQIQSLVWHAAAYRVVNESRCLTPPDKDGEVKLNGLVHELIDHGFFTSQAVAIRRLLDGYKLDDPKRGVYSLVSLLEDLRAHAGLVTRRHVFDAEKLAYDYSSIREEHIQYRDERRKAGEPAYGIPWRLNYHQHEKRHEELDRLCGVVASERSEDDSMSPAVFEALRDRLREAGQGFQQMVDKYLAHAASPESRATVNADNDSVTLAELWEAHKVICQVANFLSVYVLGSHNLGFLAIPQYDPFRYITRPLAHEEAVPELQAAWKDFENEIHKWALWGLNEFETISDSSGETEKHRER